MIKQKGFTLVELMIASVIGLIIMAGILNLFINTNRNITLSDALSQNQETGRFTMEFITKNTRLAGYSEDDVIGSVPGLLLPFVALTCAADDEAEACAANNPANARGDRLAIPFVVLPGATYRACTGTVIEPSAGDPTQVANVFWVSNATDTNRELVCRTFDIINKVWHDDQVSIINNVEAFEFQVGIANSSSELYAASYVTVDNITDLSLIRSIRIAILTTSQNQMDENKLQTNIETRTYNLLDAQYEITDGNLRTIFTNTIDLPNLLSNIDVSDPT